MNSNNYSLSSPTYARVSDRLREEIINNTFPSGVRLKVAELCKRYLVSQMPVREALQQLQGEGLIIIEPNKGAIVREIDEKFIRNMYDIRGAIEMLLVRLSIHNLTTDDIINLENIQRQLQKVAEQNEIVKYIALNKKFHHSIYQSADNPEAIKIISRHWELIDNLRNKYLFGNHRLEEVNTEHIKLIDFLARKEVENAEKLIYLHCENAKYDLLFKMSQAK